MGSAFENLGLTEDSKEVVQDVAVNPTPSAYATVTGTQEEERFEQGLEIIKKDLPNNGRILRGTDGKLYYTDKYYSTADQDEIKNIIDSITTGDDIDPSGQAVSRINRDILSTEDELPLIAQQYKRGMMGGGSWADEMYTNDPVEKFKYEKMRKAYETEYPEKAYPAQLAGLATSAYALSKLPGGAQAIPKYGKNIKTGFNAIKNWYGRLPPVGQTTAKVAGTTAAAGVEGLLFGAGDGDTSDDRTVNALETSGMNMAVTAPLTVAFPIIGNFISRFKPVKQQIQHIATEFGISIEAARFIKEAFESGASMKDMLSQAERVGDSKMLADANEAFVSLVDASKASSPSVGNVIDQRVTGRVEKKSNELQQDIDTTLGVKPEGTQTIIEKVSKDTAGARGDAYNKAYNHVVDYKSTVGKKIKTVLNRVDPKDMEEAITEANKMLRDKGMTQFQVMARFDNLGNLSLEKDLNFVQLDYIKRGLDTLGGKIDNIGQPTPSAIMSQGQSRDLRNALVQSNPAYGDALAIGQGKIKTQQAIVLGSKLLNTRTTLDEVKRMVKSASKEELSGARQGIREQIENIMSNAKTASGQKTASEVKEAMKLVTEMSSRANKDKLKLILGENTANAMFKRLDEVRKTLEVQTGVRLGSPTAPRGEIIKQADEMVAGGAWKSIGSGNPKRAIKKMTEFLTGTGEEYTAQESGRIFKELADVLTLPNINGKNVEQALKYLNDVATGKTLSKPQASFLARTIKDALESNSSTVGTGVGTQRYMDNEQ